MSINQLRNNRIGHKPGNQYMSEEVLSWREVPEITRLIERFQHNIHQTRSILDAKEPVQPAMEAMDPTARKVRDEFDRRRVI